MFLTKKDIAKSVKTLLVMLQSLKDQQVSITLRNDTVVTGKIVEVDGDMNIELANATVEQDLFYCIEPIEKNTKKAKLNQQQQQQQPTTTATTGPEQTRMATTNQEQERCTSGDEKDVFITEERDQTCDSSERRLVAADSHVGGNSSRQTNLSETSTNIHISDGGSAILANVGAVAVDDDRAAPSTADQQPKGGAMEEGDEVGNNKSRHIGEEDNLSSATNVYDYFIVKGSRVRHIDLPTDCDMIASTKCEIERIRGRRKQWTKRDIVQPQSRDQQQQQHSA